MSDHPVAERRLSVVPHPDGGTRAPARIERSRLASRVRSALDQGSLQITAGAGFGKTTLLDQALADGIDAAWLVATPTDRDPGGLLTRLVAAIAAAAPGAGGSIAEDLAGLMGPLDPQAAASKLVEDLERILTNPLVLVIDDAERLEGAGASVEMISSLIGPARSQLRVVVSGRRPLGMRVGKARATGALAELSATDLAFTPDECAGVIQLHLGRPPSPAELEAVVSATRGWPLGVTLMSSAAEPGEGLLPQAGEQAPASLKSPEALRDFFTEEVLDSLGPQLRGAALEASIAASISPAVARALDLSPERVAELERAGVAMRHEPGRFSFHPLLREFLQERLRAESEPAELRRIHARVAPAVAEDGEPVEAIGHWLDAGEFDRAAELLSDAGLGIVHSSPELVGSLIARIPASVRTAPGLALLEAQLAAGRGEHQLVAELAGNAIDGLQGQSDLLREWMARFLLAEALYHLGDFESGPGIADGFEDPEARAAYIFGPAVGAAVAACLASDGRFDESDRIAEAVAAHPDGALVAAAEALRLAYMDLPRGRIQASIDRLSASLAELDREDPFSLRLYTMSWLGFMLEEAGHPEQVLAISERVAEDAADGTAPFMALHARNWRANNLAGAGRLAEAEANLARGGLATPGWLGYDWHMASANVAGLRGDFKEALESAERALEQVSAGSLVFRFWAVSDLVKVLVAAGRSDRAIELVTQTLGLVEERLPGEDGRYMRARMHARGAWIEDATGNQDAADDHLRSAVEAAGAEIVLIFRRDWKLLGPMLGPALERGVLEPVVTVAAIAEAAPPEPALTELLDHPIAAVRVAALEPAIASGYPGAVRRLAELASDPDEQVSAKAKRLESTLGSVSPALTFTLLGGFEVSRGGWTPNEADWGRPAAARLVRFLLVNYGRPVPEEEICEALWPELSPDGARKSLRVAISRARKVLDLPLAPESAIAFADGCYSLRRDERQRIDAAEFESAAAAAIAIDGPSAREPLERVRALWTGDPLPGDRYADWTRAWREGLIDRQIGVLARLGAIYSEAGENAAAIEVARELVGIDELNEAAHRLLITAYARAGRTGQALQQYLVCRRALVDGLGVEPSAETASLQARVLAGEPV